MSLTDKQKQVFKIVSKIQQAKKTYQPTIEEVKTEILKREVYKSSKASLQHFYKSIKKLNKSMYPIKVVETDSCSFIFRTDI